MQIFKIYPHPYNALRILSNVLEYKIEMDFVIIHKHQIHTIKILPRVIVIKSQSLNLHCNDVGLKLVCK